MSTKPFNPVAASVGELYAKLSSMHDYDPQKQAIKSTLGGREVTLYDPNSLGDEGLPQPVVVRAQNVEAYIGKGFLTEQATAPAKKGRK